MAWDNWVKLTWMWPPMRSVKAATEPRYGTCVIFTPATWLNSSPARWKNEPAPEEPNDSLPGFFLAYSTSSVTELTGTTLRLTTRQPMVSTEVTIGVKFLTGS